MKAGPVQPGRWGIGGVLVGRRPGVLGRGGHGGEARLDCAQDVPHFFFLINLAELEDLPAAVRKEASETVKLLPLRGTVVCNAPLRARVLAKLLLTAGNLASKFVGRNPSSNPVVFADTEEEGRAWIDKRRQQVAEAAA